MPLRCLNFCILLLCSTLAHASAITLPDGGVYHGEVQDDLLHGQGTIAWPNGSSYKGEFKDGQFHGFGILTYADGSTYEGEFANGVSHGRGTYSQKDGSVYAGRYDSGDFKEGSFVQAHGAEMQGHFENYQLHGEGRVSVPGQGVWSGTYQSGELSGSGKFKGEDGQEYAGEFKNWEFHGEGTLTQPDGATYTGQFENGYFQGQGTYQDSTQRYQGAFEFGQYSGPGRLELLEGDDHKAASESPEQSDQNTPITQESQVLEGTFSWGELYGDGTVYYANGDYYKGQLRSGTFHGHGEFYRSETNTLIKGYWNNGEQIFESNKKIDFLGNNAERALYHQTELLNQTLDQVAPSNDEKIEMYFVGIGGYASQGVFEREVRFAEKLLADRFDLESRSVTLINSAKHSDRYPWATVTSIERTLASIAKKMDPEQDILFLYMTSHGSESHELSLEQDGIDLPDLPAEYLAQIIRELPVRHKIIGISACYSGGFIEPLKDEYTLIITAARKDRTSFGCSDNADFTYFGRAFFEQGLATTFSFRNAFHKAFDIVSEWEEAEGQTKSEPQIYAPNRILEYLEKWYVTLPNYAPDRTKKAVLAKWWLRENLWSSIN